MMRLIDADEFRRHIDSHYPFNKAEQSRHGIADVAKNSLLLVLSNEPTVEAEPVKHGHYIKGDNGEWCCSECRKIDDKYDVAKYCWNCGARMDG